MWLYGVWFGRNSNYLQVGRSIMRIYTRAGTQEYCLDLSINQTCHQKLLNHFKSKKTSKFLSPEASLGGKENTNKTDSHSSSNCSTQFLMDDMWRYI